MVIFLCMAHAHCKFYDSKDNDSARAEHALAEIAKLYKVEEECKEQRLDEAQIRMRRAEKSLPVLKVLEEWLKQEYVKLRPKSPIALGYGLQHQTLARIKSLCHYRASSYR
jgi:transposase